MPKMKGWMFNGKDKELELVVRDVPKAKPGYCVIKVAACGLCHSDVGAIDDPEGWSYIVQTPVILGHEIAGYIVECGEGVEGFKPGDRVAVCPMMAAAKDGTGPGYGGRDGGYATYTTAPVETLIPLADNVDIVMAAAATDAGMTSHHAIIDRGQVKEGTKVGIIGIGGLGTVGMRIAVGAGAQVYCATRNPKAQQDALDHGAYKVSDSILDFKDEGLEVIVDFAGFGNTTADALETVAYGGTVVQVGMGKLEATISTNRLILNECQLVGSVGGDKGNIEAVIDLIQQGKLVLDTNEVAFDDVPQGLDDVRNGVKKVGRSIMVTKDSDYE